MRFPTDSKLLAFVSFTGFLFNHIDEIRPSVIVFLFAPGHEAYVDHIAVKLAGRQMRFVKVANESYPKISTIKDDALLLSFLAVCHHNNSWVRFEFVVRTFMIVLKDGDRNGGIFEDVPLQNPHPCMAWRSTRLTNYAHEMLEVDLLHSFHWNIFTGHATQLVASPNGYRFLCYVDNLNTDRMEGGYYEDSTGKVLIMHGFRIGIYKILAEMLHADYMRYYVSEVLPVKPRIWLTKRDERLRAMSHITTQSIINIMSLIPKTHQFPFQFPHKALQTRYMVVVPRIMVNSQCKRSRAIRIQVLVVLGLMLSTGFFVVIRFVCRLGKDGQWPVDGSAWSVHSLFDTWARTLSVRAGQWMGRSRAERQMLTVIAVFAVLSEIIFTAVHYKQLLDKDEVRYLYNSLNDICREGMVLRIPQELIPDYSFGNRNKNGTVLLPSRNCTLILDVYLDIAEVNESDSAVVVPERDLRSLVYSHRTTMVLDEPYLVHSGNIGVRQQFMKTLVSKWMSRLVDHGIIEAFNSTADNYERMLDRKRLLMGEFIVVDAQPVNPMIEYWVLAIGLSMAGLAFIGELVAVGRLTFGTFGWRAGRKSTRVQSMAATESG